MITQRDLPDSPFIKANIFSKLFFSWLTPFFWKGSQRDVEISDLFKTLPNDKSKKLGDGLARQWAKEVKKPEPSLRRAIVKEFGLYYVGIGILAFVEECMTRIAQPLFLGMLIRFFTNKEDYKGYEGYVFASAVVLASAFYTFTHHLVFFGYQHVGMKIRIACCSLVYRKSLRLSQSALVSTNVGQLTNLLSNDVNRFDQCTLFLHYLWVGPLQTAIVTYILWGYYGPSCLAGLVVLVLFVPFQGYCAKLFSQLRANTAGKSDKRIRIMNEIVGGIRVIKMYTWEKPFAALVNEARKEEVKVIKNTSRLRAVNMALFYTSPRLIIFLTLLTYVLTDHVLTAEKVFVTVSLYNNVLLIMTLFFPNGVSQAAETQVSISRLQKYLLLEEVKEPSDESAIPHGGTQDNEKDDNHKQAEIELNQINSNRNSNEVSTDATQINTDVVSNGLNAFNRVSTDVIRNRLSTGSNSRNTDVVKNGIETDINQNDGKVVTNIIGNPDIDQNRDQNQNKIGIVVENLTAKWSSAYSDNSLTNVSLKVSSGELIAVIGHVGSGKGSLLNAILKELPASSGHVSVNGKVAYATQEPWVFAGSVRENILFGLDFNPSWYEKVISACALKRDIDLFPYGDRTLVGDRGASLSGGQKARITLARAVYANADIYLLDDPLSAVDAEVGRHLFDECICGILKEKAIILVTHQLQFLKLVPQIILLESGTVQSQGTYDHLIESGIDFAQLLNFEPDDNSTSGEFGSSRSSFRRLSSRRRSRKLPEPSQDGFESGRKTSLSITKRGDTPISNDVREPTRSRSDTPETGPKVTEEATNTGGVKWSLYWKYFMAGSGCCGFVLLILFNLITQFLFTGADWWLKFWTRTQQEGYKVPVGANDTLYELYTNRDIQVYTYSAIITALFIASISRTLLLFAFCMKASINLHDWMFKGIIRAPISFFETNPIGRILNRFSKDIGQMDDLLPMTFFDMIGIFLNVAGILVIVGVVNPILLAPSAAMFIIFYFLRRYYLKTARRVKRLEGVARSPVFSHLSTSLYGLTTIRAFGAEKEFCKQFDEHQDMHTSSYFLLICTTRWFGILLDWLSVAYIATVAFSFMLFSNDGAQVGLAVSSALMLTGMFQFGVRQSAEVENQMVGVERVLEYTEIEPESSLESTDDKRPPKDWPTQGEIVMKKVQLKYGENVPVIRDVTCVFKSKEKIGIVGRTGAGKSSLITALFRITEPTGEIKIDGVNVLEIGLHDLRSKMSIIPQDPVLFTGSLRKNLDPFNNYTDEEIWRVLEEVHLADEVRQTAAGLLVEVAEGGSNFSVGQRQLVCLGRAILRKNKILVLDEATANVDPETDALIQKTIRTKFLDCTVLTVAHRLHTVMDSDKILVLDAGTVKEYDEPYILLQSKSSSLYSLVQQTGSATADNLYKIAKEAHLKRRDIVVLSGDGT